MKQIQIWTWVFVLLLMRSVSAQTVVSPGAWVQWAAPTSGGAVSYYEIRYTTSGYAFQLEVNRARVPSAAGNYYLSVRACNREFRCGSWTPRSLFAVSPRVLPPQTEPAPGVPGAIEPVVELPPPPPPPPEETFAVTSVTPNSGPASGGTTVTVSGTGFVSGDGAVFFGATPATVQSLSGSTTLTVITPPGSGLVDVTVQNPNGATATLAYAYTYAADPSPPPPPPPPPGGGSVIYRATYDSSQDMGRLDPVPLNAHFTRNYLPTGGPNGTPAYELRQTPGDPVEQFYWGWWGDVPLSRTAPTYFRFQLWFDPAMNFAGNGPLGVVKNKLLILNDGCGDGCRVIVTYGPTRTLSDINLDVQIDGGGSIASVQDVAKGVYLRVQLEVSPQGYRIWVDNRDQARPSAQSSVAINTSRWNDGVKFGAYCNANLSPSGVNTWRHADFHVGTAFDPNW